MYSYPSQSMPSSFGEGPLAEQFIKLTETRDPPFLHKDSSFVLNPISFFKLSLQDEHNSLRDCKVLVQFCSIDRDWMKGKKKSSQ